MDAVQSTIEQACAGLEVPSLRKQAEATLLEFRQSSKPIPACQHILEHSSSLPARFQAAATLKEAAVREWSSCSPEQKQHLRSYLLHASIRHGAEHGDIVASQLTATLARVLKKGWLDASEEERHSFFTEAEKLVSTQGGNAARRAGIRLLEAVVVEFSPATASPLGLPWDYHERCRAGLEAVYLQSFFAHASSIARSHVQGGVEGTDGGVCQACLSLLSSILSWDFREPGLHMPVYGAGRPSSTGMLVKPEKGWREILLAPEAVDWLIALLNAVHRTPDLPLAVAARQLLVLFCSVTGEVFLKEVEEQRAQLGLAHGASAKVVYLERLLAAVVPWISPAEAAIHSAAAGSEAALLDACKALAVLAQVHRASGFVKARPSGSTEPLGSVAELTKACIAAGGLSEDAEGTWVADATDMLLDTWSELLFECAIGTAKTTGGSSAVESAAAFTAFQALVEGSLHDAAACAHQDEAEGEAADDAGAGAMAAREEWFARAAAVGRASAAESAALLTRCIADKQRALQHCTASGQDPSEPLEELHWLTRMVAHLLADSGEGETPLVPLPVAAAAAAADGHGGMDPVEQLSHALLGVAGLCLDETVRPVASPRLMEAAASGVARWAHTYLMSDEPASKALGAAFGPQGGAPAVLHILLQIANVLLSQYPGEVDLHRVVAARLLPVLTQQRAISPYLAHADAWRALVQAFAEQAEPIRALSGPAARALARALTVAAGALPDEAAARHFVVYLMHSIAEEVSAIAGRQDLAAIAERPDVMARVGYLLETLRGCMRGTNPRAQPALFSLASAVMSPLVTLHRVYHNQPAVTCQLLKLAADVVEAHVSYIKKAEYRLLCEWLLHLLKQYSSYNLGQINLAAAARLRAEAAAESYRDMKALVKLLMHLTQRDVVDFCGEETSQGVEGPIDVAQVVFLGLDIVIPLVSGELLHFPKLVRAFFSLVSFMMEVYPEHVACLPGQQMRILLSALEYGVNAADMDVAQASLEAVAALSKCHLQAKHCGSPGLTSSEGGFLLAAFLELIFRRLLMEDLGMDTLELAADAVFPLILSDPTTFQSLGGSLLTSLQDSAAQHTLNNALNNLVTMDASGQQLSRGNRQRFRAKFSKFILEARSVVRLR